MLPTERAGYNTPKVDVLVASLLGLNLRDSTSEDNVRKRPFPLSFDPLTLAGYLSRRQRYEKISEPPSDSEIIFQQLIILPYLILRFKASGFIRVSQMSTIRTVFDDG